MQAINDYVVINVIKEEPKNVGGFLITESTTKDIRYVKASIFSVGNMTQGLSVGDLVYFDKHAGHDIFVDEKQYRVIKQRDIVLVE